MRIFQMVGADPQGRMAGNFVTEQDYRDVVGRLDMRVYELEQSKAREAALQALLNERDAELDRLRSAQVEDAPEGATHFVVRRWFRINGECRQFLNEYGRWQNWTRSHIKGLTAIARGDK